MLNKPICSRSLNSLSAINDSSRNLSVSLYGDTSAVVHGDLVADEMTKLASLQWGRG